MRNVSTQQLPAADESEAAHIREALDGQFVCPFCGVVNSTGEGLCPRCSMENTPAARKATKSRIGPWYVYQHRNPAAPGMKFETLLAFVRKGKVKPRSIVRGPTTGQLWRFAAHVKGLSREFGVCYSCGAAIETTANICAQCNHLQEPPINPDVLLESAADQQRAPTTPTPAKSTGTPGQAVRSAQTKSGPFSSDIADTQLPPIDDLLIGNDPPPPQIGTAPVAAFRKPNQQDDFLSARELATAFNLGFTPPSGSRAGRRRRKGGWAKRITIFLLLIVVGASGGVLLQPQLRQRVFDWTSQKWQSLQPVASAKNPKKADSASSSDEGDLPKAVRDAHALPNRGSSSATTAPTTKPSEHKTTASPPPNTQKQPVINNPTPQTQPAVVQKQPDARPPSTGDQTSSTSTSNQKPPVPPPSDNPATADAADQARTLYNQGIDAEQHVDFAAAVKCYEKIMKLPRDVWPTDLELRLRLARKQAEQK